MDRSLFAVFQIIESLVASHPRGLEWFAKVEQHYALTGEQRDILAGNRRRAPELDILIRQISRDEDRLRLVNWVRMLGELDGHVSAKDEDVLRRARGFSLPNTTAYAEALVAHENTIEFWRELEALGRDLKKRRALPILIERILRRW